MSFATKIRSKETPAAAPATVEHPASATVAPVGNYRVAGTTPDHAGAWVDEKDHAQDAISNAHAIAEAAILAVAKKKTGDRDGRFMFLNSLDRVDDPETRHKMMDHYKSITGEKLDTTIENADWHSGRDKQQALDLISTKRDEAHHTLASLSPADRKQLDADAEKWAAKILDVTRIDDANDDVNARKITNVLGQRKPHEIEAIRAAIRAQTRGTKERSIYEELDRSLSGGDEDEALAGLKGDPVHSANMALINAHGDADRVSEVLGRLKPEQLTDLKKRNEQFGTGTEWIATSVPATQQAEVKALLDNQRTGEENAAADGAHVAELFADPTKRLSTTSMLDQQQMKDLSTHSSENIIGELRAKTPAQIKAAREAWESAHPGQSWDTLIEKRFGDGDANTYLRMKALASGDTVGERAYALREAMRNHDQAAIEAALASPNLQNDDDPMKKAIAHAERLALMGRMRELDAHDQRATAAMTGADPSKVVGRTFDQQLAASYADYVSTEPTVESPGDALKAMTTYKDEDERTSKAKHDRIATNEMLQQGDLSLATRIHRAQQSGDNREQAKIFDGIQSNERLGEVKTEFSEKYGGEMMKPLATDHFSLYARTFGDSDDPEQVAKLSERIALEAQSTDALKVSHVRDHGVRAERDPALQAVLQKDVNAKAHSGSLDGAQMLRAMRGGNVGTEDLVRANQARLESKLDPSWNPLGGQPRRLREGISEDEFRRADDTMSQHQDVQVDEKKRHAEKEAAALMMPLKLAALAAGNPLLYAMLDGATSVAGMAYKHEVAGGDYDSSGDLEGLGIQTLANLGSAGISSLAAAQKISANTATVGNLGLQVGASLAGGMSRGDSSESMGLDAGRAIAGSFLPSFLGKGAEGLIRGDGGVAKAARNALGVFTRGATNYGINGGGGLQGAVDAFGSGAADTFQANHHPSSAHPDVVASGHFAEDHVPHHHDSSSDSKSDSSPRIEAGDDGRRDSRSDHEILLEIHAERVRELQASGAHSRSGFHGTNTAILPGLQQFGGALLSAKALADRDFDQQAGEGDRFSTEEGHKDVIHIGVSEPGLGTALAYAHANQSLSQYNPSLLRREELHQQIAELTELTARYPEVQALAHQGGLVGANGQPNGGYFQQRGFQSRGQLTSTLRRLEGEERVRARLDVEDPSNSRIQGGPENNAHHALLFEFDTHGLNAKNVPRFEPGHAFDGEAIVRKPIDLSTRMSRAYVPLAHLEAARSQLTAALGHDSFELLSIEALHESLTPGTDARLAHDATFSAVSTLQRDVSSVQRMYLDALRTGKPMDLRTLIEALTGKKFP